MVGGIIFEGEYHSSFQHKPNKNVRHFYHGIYSADGIGC